MLLQTDAQDKWLWKSESKIWQIWKQKVRYHVIEQEKQLITVKIMDGWVLCLNTIIIFLF